MLVPKSYLKVAAPMFNSGIARRVHQKRCIVSNGKIMSGMLVLELANVLAGPSVGQFLAELGATVIKVESTMATGDVTRTWRLPGEDLSPSKVSAYFSSCNSGKQSIRLNLASREGLSILHKLSDKADVVLASYKPGDAEKLGVDAATLTSRNPKLVYGQITGYGRADPRPGYDAVIQAETGFMNMNGTPESPPCKMPVAMMDLLASHQLKEAILVALWRRDTVNNGRGAAVEVSLFKAGVASLANQATGYLQEGIEPSRIGSDHPSIVPYGTSFQTLSKPGSEPPRVVLAVGSDKQFQQLCKVLNRPDIANEQKYATNPARVENRKELLSELAQSIAQFDRSELLQQLAEHHVPAGAVNTMADLFELEVAQSLVYKDDVSGSPNGMKQIAFESSSSMPEVQQDDALLPPPIAGQHTRQVLKTTLSMSNDEIQLLFETNVIS